MFGRRPHPWLWSAGILLVLGGLGAWFFRSLQPLAKLTLPDGTAISLDAVTSRSEFRYTARRSVEKGWWRRIRQFFAAPQSSITLRGKGPHFIFSCRTAKPDDFFQIGMIRTFLDSGHPIEAYVHTTDGLVAWDRAIFPRRGKTFRVQLQVKNQWHDWDLPNPLYGTDFPVWKAEDFPIKRTVGDFEFVAHEWKPGTSGPYLPFQISHKGKRVEWPVVISSARLYSDPTGNESNNLLLREEAAWKVRQTMTVGKQAPLSPEHSVRFPATQVPQPGETGMQLVEGLPNARGRKFFGYAGKGSYQFTDGVPVPVDPARSAEIAGEVAAKGGVPNISDSANGRSWTISGAVEKPTFIIVDEVSNGRSSCEYGYRRGEEWTTLSTSTHSGENSVDVRQMPIDAPPGTAVDFQIFWTESLEVEFFVKPPPMGMGASKK